MMSRTPLSVAHRIRLTPPEPCVFCTFNRNYGPVQKRHLAARRAPSTRHKSWSEKPKVLTPEMEQSRKRMSELEEVLAATTDLTYEAKLAIFSGNRALTERLSDGLAHFYADFRKSRQTEQAFDEALRRSGINVDEVYQSTFVLRNLGAPDQAKFGRFLVRCCDRAGLPEATIQSVASLLRQDIVNPGMLRTSDAKLAQGRLKILCQQGNIRALVLNGKLAERSGDPELAISLYENATNRFMDLAGETTSSPENQITKHLDEFSSPWMELGILHLRRGNRKQALAAYMMGIAQDDPMAHHMLARLDYQFTGEKYTLDWLYHTTKAAASGHFRAAFSLGEYYANTKAPPPVDQHIPQAQTESHPAVSPNLSTAPKPQSSFLARVQHFLTTALIKPTVETDARTAIADYAAAVQDPVARVRLAREWFRTATEQAYVPAYMNMARLHFRTHVTSENNLAHPVIITGDAQVEAPRGGVANPIFDLRAGHDCLLQVFDAHSQITLGRAKTKVETEFRVAAGRWAEYPDVLEDYEHDLGKFVAEAEELANVMRIDIIDPETGTAVYKYKRDPIEDVETAL